MYTICNKTLWEELIDRLRKLLQAFASTVILTSGSRGVHGHIFVPGLSEELIAYFLSLHIEY
jgi:hypothetical protein